MAGILPTTESNLRTAVGVEICKLGIIARKTGGGAVTVKYCWIIYL